MSAVTSGDLSPSKPLIPEEPTLRDLLYDLWRARWSVLLTTLALLCASFAFCMNATPYYRAAMIIAPAQPHLDTVSPQRIDSSGGVLSPAGILQSTKEDGRRDSFTRLEAILTGTAVSSILSDTPQIVRHLKQDHWRFLSDPGAKTHIWINEYLSRAMSIRHVGNTGLRKLVYSHPDPQFARDFLRAVFSAADNTIRKQDITDLKRRVLYLKNTLKTTENPDQKKALTLLLTLQEQKLMLASAQDSYAGKILDPPSISSKPTWPRLPIFVAFSILLGILGGYLFYIIIRSLRL